MTSRPREHGAAATPAPDAPLEKFEIDHLLPELDRAKNPPTFTAPDANAIKAWASGTADAEQQRRAFRVVTEKICRAGYDSQHAKTEDTFIAIGMRRVAILIGRMVQAPINDLRKNNG